MTITAELSAASGQDVSVPFSLSGTATEGGGNDYTITATPVSISAGDTTATITITVNDDALDEASETVIINMGAPTNASQGVITAHMATITDNDVTPSVTLTAASQSGAEDAGTLTITAELSAASGQDVSVPFSLSGTATEGGGNDYTITATPVSISAGDTTATITITVNDDALDEASETVIVTMGAPTNASQGATTEHTATIMDNDATPSITIADVTVDESAGTADVVISLSAKSASDITVDYITQNTTAIAGADYTAINGTITWNALNNDDQTISISITEDSVAESSDTLAVVLSNVSNATISDNSASITITDNDTNGITLTQSSGSTTVTEGGSSDTFTLVLSSEPTDDVTISVTTDSQLTVDGASESVVFTDSNWNIPATVTVSAVDDDYYETNHTGDVSFSVASDDSNYNEIVISGSDSNTLEVSIVDDDSYGISVTESSGDTEITEGGASDTISFVLTSVPYDDVVITVNYNMSGKIDSISSATLTFTQGNWDSAQEITLSPSDNDLVDGNSSETVSFSVTSAGDSDYNSVSLSNVTVSIIDDDNAGIVISHTSSNTAITEDGDTDSFNMVLSSEPTADVTVTLSYSDAQVTLSPETLTFTSSNWDEAQAVTATAIDDDIAEGSHSINAIFATASSDSDYNNIASSNILISITDNDTAGIDVDEESTTSSEGQSGSYSIRLNSEPTNAVSITITSDLLESDETIEFGTDDWDEYQIVSFDVPDNDLVDGTRTEEFNHFTSSQDSNYNALDVDEAITVLDDDSATGTLSRETINISEGNTFTYTLMLDSEPSDDVTVNLSSSASLSFVPSNIIFNSSNWSSVQSINVLVHENNESDGDRSISINHLAESDDLSFHNLSLGLIAVHISDDDNDSDDEFDDTVDQTTQGVELVSCRTTQCIASSSQDCIIDATSCESFINDSGCDYTWSQYSGETIAITENSDTSVLVALSDANDSPSVFHLTASCSGLNIAYAFPLEPLAQSTTVTRQSGQIVEARIVATKSSGAYISETFTSDNYGVEKSILTTSSGLTILTGSSESVNVIYIEDSNTEQHYVIVGDPTHDDNRGIVVSIHSDSLPEGTTEIDITDTSIHTISGIAIMEGPRTLSQFGYQLMPVYFPGNTYVASLVPGTTYGSVYILDLIDLEPVHIINGTETDNIRSRVVNSADIDGNNYSDTILGITTTEITGSVSVDETGLNYSVSNTAPAIDAILGDNSLSSVLSISVDKDIEIALPYDDEIEYIVDGDFNGDDITDIVLVSNTNCRIYTILGNSSLSTTSILEPSILANCSETSSVSAISTADFTSDGTDDLAISFSNANDGNGRIYILSGKEDIDSDSFSFDQAMQYNGSEDTRIGACLYSGDHDSDSTADLYTCLNDDRTMVLDIFNKSVSTIDSEDDSDETAVTGAQTTGSCRMQIMTSNHISPALILIMMLVIVAIRFRRQNGSVV